MTNPLRLFGMLAWCVALACCSPTPDVEKIVPLTDEQIPKLEPGTRYRNVDLGFALLGWEPSARRFWVIANRRQVDDGSWRDKVLLELHGRYRTKCALDSEFWKASFFSDEKDAHYKPFPEESYLGEYFSCRAHEEAMRNHVNIRPFNARWKAGPKELDCGFG